MDCYSLTGLMAVRAQARRAGGDLVLVGPQPVVLRLLVLCDMASDRLVFTSVDKAAGGAGSASAAPLTPGTAGCATASPAISGIVSSALVRGRAAVRHARMLPGLITAASRKQHDRGTHAPGPLGSTPHDMTASARARIASLRPARPSPAFTGCRPEMTASAPLTAP